MADTLTNIPVTAETWLEVYDLSSISPGKQISIQNIGVSDLYYSISSLQPPKNSDKYRIFRRGDVINLLNGDLKIWVFSPQIKGLINIEEYVFSDKSAPPSDFLFEIAQGSIPGMSSLGFLTRKLNVGESFEDLWGESGSMSYPTAAEDWEILSDNPNDNSTGSGGRVAVITSLDENFLERTDVVLMNGITPVSIPGKHIRPQLVIIIESGSSGWNEGTIKVRDVATPANTRNVVLPEDSISFDGHITVPADKNGFIAQTYTMYPKGVDGKSLVSIRDAGNPNASWIRVSSFPIYQNVVPFTVNAFFPLAPKTDLNSQAKVSTSTGEVTIIYEFIFVDI